MIENDMILIMRDKTKQWMRIRNHEQSCFEMLIILWDSVQDVKSVMLLKYSIWLNII
jgi:hypothetical protein